MLDRSSAPGGNSANDLTAPIVQALDAKVTTNSFNREILPATQGQPAPAR